MRKSIWWKRRTIKMIKNPRFYAWYVVYIFALMFITRFQTAIDTGEAIFHGQFFYFYPEHYFSALV